MDLQPLFRRDAGSNANWNPGAATGALPPTIPLCGRDVGRGGRRGPWPVGATAGSQHHRGLCVLAVDMAAATANEAASANQRPRPFGYSLCARTALYCRSGRGMAILLSLGCPLRRSEADATTGCTSRFTALVSIRPVRAHDGAAFPGCRIKFSRFLLTGRIRCVVLLIA